MKIKNLDWITKPEKIKYIKSNEIEFKLDNSEHYLLYTFCDNEEFEIAYNKSEKVNLFLTTLFSPDEELTFIKEGTTISINLKLLGIESTTLIENITGDDLYRVRKKDDTLFFYYSNILLNKFSFSTIKESVSIGIKVNGNGKLRVSFN